MLLILKLFLLLLALVFSFGAGQLVHSDIPDWYIWMLLAVAFLFGIVMLVV